MGDGIPDDREPGHGGKASLPGSGRPSAAPRDCTAGCARHGVPCRPMRDLVLYGNHESGHSYKVRLFLALGGVPYRYVWVDLDVPRDAGRRSSGG